MLQLLLLKPAKRGRYATADASLQPNNWAARLGRLVRCAGDQDQADISGYPPHAVKQTGPSEQVSLGEHRQVRDAWSRA